MQDIEHSFNSPKYELVISNGGPFLTYVCVFVQLCSCICQPVFVYVSKYLCVCVQMCLCMRPNVFVYVSKRVCVCIQMFSCMCPNVFVYIWLSLGWLSLPWAPREGPLASFGASFGSHGVPLGCPWAPLAYLTLPYLTLPYLSLHYLTLPYLTLP